MKQPATTPIAIFAYKRPKHFNALMESLAKCDGLENCELFFYFDGLKKEEDSARVEETRRIGKSWVQRLAGKAIFRDENLGLTRSVTQGVSELCESFGRVIVFEDDLLCSPHVLSFLRAGLAQYETDERISQVSGYMYPIRTPGQENGVFLRYISCWGWAVWQRSWKLYQSAAPGAREALASPEFRNEFDLGGSYPYSNMLQAALDGTTESWGILWQWAVYQSGGLVLYPRDSLVWNSGFDGSGSHPHNPLFAKNADQWDTPFWKGSLRLPETPAVDPVVMHRLSQLLRRSESPGTYTLRGRLTGLLRRAFG